MAFEILTIRSIGRSGRMRAALLSGAFVTFAAALPGCTQMPDSMSAAFADPAKYEQYSCLQLRTARRENSKRIAELRGLVARADTAAGGAVVAEVAYGNDLVTARAQANLADEAWKRNHCDREALPPEKPDPQPDAPAATKPSRR